MEREFRLEDLIVDAAFMVAGGSYPGIPEPIVVLGFKRPDTEPIYYAFEAMDARSMAANLEAAADAAEPPS